MQSIKSLLSWILILSLFTSCTSVPIQLETAAVGDATLKQAALNSLFNTYITKDTIFAIKRSGITIQWSNPVQAKGKNFGKADGYSAVIQCVKYDNNCTFYSMVGKVNSNTSIIAGLYVGKGKAGTKVFASGGQVIQKQALGSNRVRISGMDMVSKQVAYGEIDVPAGQLKASSVSGKTARLVAIGPTKGYQSLGQLLTVNTNGSLRTTGGTPLLPCSTYNSDLHPTCGGGGGGSPTTPAAPVPQPGSGCTKVDCREKQRNARTGAWEVVAGYATVATGVAGAVTACVGTLGTGCQVAVLGGIAAVTTGGFLISEGENRKQTYEDCLEDKLLSNC